MNSYNEIISAESVMLYLIKDNFNLKVSDIEFLDKHFGTELYLINTNAGKYIVKVLPLYMENVKNEGELTEYLLGGSAESGSLGVAALDHKVLDDSVEDYSVIELLANELFEILNGLGCYVGVKSDNDLSVVLNVDDNVIGLLFGLAYLFHIHPAEVDVLVLNGTAFTGCKTDRECN